MRRVVGILLGCLFSVCTMAPVWHASGDQGAIHELILRHPVTGAHAIMRPGQRQLEVRTPDGRSLQFDLGPLLEQRVGTWSQRIFYADAVLGVVIGIGWCLFWLARRSSGTLLAIALAGIVVMLRAGITVLFALAAQLWWGVGLAGIGFISGLGCVLFWPLARIGMLIYGMAYLILATVGAVTLFQMMEVNGHPPTILIFEFMKEPLWGLMVVWFFFQRRVREQLLT